MRLLALLLITTGCAPSADPFPTGAPAPPVGPGDGGGGSSVDDDLPPPDPDEPPPPLPDGGSGPAVRFEVHGQTDVIRSEATVDVEVVAIDAQGDPTRPDVSWTVREGGFDLHAIAATRLRVTGSGWATLVATDARSGLQSSFVLGVDRDRPVVRIDHPRRGSFLSAPEPLVVEGRVTDDIGVASLSIDGVEVALAEDGTFRRDLGPQAHGLRVIATEAADVTARHREGARSVLYGDLGEQGGWVPQGLRTSLNATFLDDDDPDLDDVAAMAESFVTGGGFSPDRVPLECGGYMDLSNLRYDPPQVDLWPEDGGVGARVTVTGLIVDFSGDYCGDVWLLDCTCAAIAGEGRAVSVTASARATVGAADCRVDVRSEPAVAVVDGLDVDVELFGGLPVPGFLVGLFLDSTTAEMEAAIAAKVDETLEGVLGGVLADISMPPTLPLPPPIGGELPFEACLTDAEIDATGARFDSDVRFPAELAIAMPPGAGPLQTAGDPPSLGGDHALGVSVDDDLINAVFFAAWAAGRLKDVPISLAPEGGDGGGAGADLPLPLDGLTFTALLPPVLLPGSPRDGALTGELALGDVMLRASLDAGEAVAAVSVSLPVLVRVEGDHLVIEPTDVEGDVTFELEVLEFPEEAGLPGFVFDAMEVLFRGLALPVLQDQALALPLPGFGADGLPIPGFGGRSLAFRDAALSLDGPAGDHLSVRTNVLLQ